MMETVNKCGSDQELESIGQIFHASIDYIT